MNQQQNILKERVEQWALANGFKFKAINEFNIHLERLSDGYPFQVNIRLLDQIMTDEGF